MPSNHGTIAVWTTTTIIIIIIIIIIVIIVITYDWEGAHTGTQTATNGRRKIPKRRIPCDSAVGRDAACHPGG